MVPDKCIERTGAIKLFKFIEKTISKFNAGNQSQEKY